jgi:putative tryptophan/tyrosine transport system substrate-binding protein
MRRREFIRLAGGAAAGWPFAARAQQPAKDAAMPVLGYLGGPSPDGAPAYFAGLRQGLKDAGFVEGQNITIDYRSTEDRYERFSGFALDLVRQRVNVIFACGDSESLAARAATKTTIPIVFAVDGNPLDLRLVASLERPGTNATGVSFWSKTVLAKRLDLLHQAVPNATVVAALINQADGSAVADASTLQHAASKLGLQLNILYASNERQIDAAFATLTDRKVGAIVIEADAFLSDRQDQLIALAARQGIPAVYAVPENAVAGGLMAYGASVADAFRQAGTYIGRILKGEKPAELPVVPLTKFDLVINLKTAAALGLTIPQTLIVTADQVIQ